MRAMPTLRRAHLLARLVLLWFVLAIGAAVASPMVQPQSMELVCSGAGAIKVVVKGGDGTQAPAAHTLDCPLCLGLGAPPPVARAPAVPMQPQRQVPPLRAAVHIAQASAAPLPARGPPNNS